MIELPSAFAESSAYPPDRALPGSPRQCSLPLARRHPSGGHQMGARKRRTPGNTILSQPYRRRVSTDRPNREGIQLAASLEGEPSPIPAGKTLPHSYPETRFRRKRHGHQKVPPTCYCCTYPIPLVDFTCAGCVVWSGCSRYAPLSKVKLVSHLSLDARGTHDALSCWGAVCTRKRTAACSVRWPSPTHSPARSGRFRKGRLTSLNSLA